MTSIGYVRQSRKADLDVALSPESQRQDIRRLAERDGLDPDDVLIYEDLGRSGGAGKERLRDGYQAVLAAVGSGSVDVVYTKALTRIARSVTELYRVLRLAQEHGTRIVTAKEGVMDPTTPIGKAQFGMMAVFAEFERDLAVERAKDNVALRRARGERMGGRPYGDRSGDDPALVLAYYRKAGTYNGAAAALNADGIPSPYGGQGRVNARTGTPMRWSGTGVRVVLERHHPNAIPARTPRGRRHVPTYVFWRLLRCPCGGWMTGSTWRGVRVYRCHRAEADRSHPRPAYISEATVREWAEPEAERFLKPAGVELAAQDTERAALVAERDRIVRLFTRGTIDEPTMDGMVAEVDDRLAVLDTTARIVELPSTTIDWDRWSTDDIRAVLRSLWSAVRLEHRDSRLEVAEAEWKVPTEWVA
jgi:DNA invertase Pin-like site-specific DNA recombinase